MSLLDVIYASRAGEGHEVAPTDMGEKWSREEYLSALHAIDPSIQENEWVRVGMAAKDAGLTLEDFTDWSRPASNFISDEDCKKHWDSFKPDGGITAGTLIHMARGRGWTSTFEEQRQDAIRKHEQGSKADKNRFPPIEHADLKHTPERPDSIIEDVLLEKHVMTLTGPSKAGKTYALIELAIAICCNLEWFGFRCKRGRVLYVNMEVSPTTFKRRIAKVAKCMGADSKEIDARLDLWNLRGKACDIESVANELCNKHADDDYTLIVLDPFYMLESGDENSAKDMKDDLYQIGRICEGLGAAVALSHHHSKGGKGDVASIDRGSGSGVFARYPDAIIDMVEVFPSEETMPLSEGESAFQVSMSLREFPAPKPFNVVFKHPLHRVDEDGYTDGYKPRSSQQRAGRASASVKKAKKEERAAKNELMIAEMFLRGNYGNGGIPMKEVREALEISDTRTVKRLLEDSDLFEVENPDSKTCVVKLKSVEGGCQQLACMH